MAEDREEVVEAWFQGGMGVGSFGCFFTWRSLSRVTSTKMKRSSRNDNVNDVRVESIAGDEERLSIVTISARYGMVSLLLKGRRA